MEFVVDGLSIRPRSVQYRILMPMRQWGVRALDRSQGANLLMRVRREPTLPHPLVTLRSSAPRVPHLPHDKPGPTGRGRTPEGENEWMSRALISQVRHALDSITL